MLSFSPMCASVSGCLSDVWHGGDGMGAWLGTESSLGGSGGIRSRAQAHRPNVKPGGPQKDP